jgi:hypothetical protein
MCANGHADLLVPQVILDRTNPGLKKKEFGFDHNQFGGDLYLVIVPGVGT